MGKDAMRLKGLSLHCLREVRTEGMILSRHIPVLKQLIMDEFDACAVEPQLLHQLLSLMLYAPHAQLIGLTIRAIWPLVHLKRLGRQ